MFVCPQSWTFTPQQDLEKRILAFENNCYRRLLEVYYAMDTHNEDIRRRVAGHLVKYDTLLGIVKKRKISGLDM